MWAIHTSPTQAVIVKINMKLKLTELYGIYIYILPVHLYMFHTQNIYNSLFHRGETHDESCTLPVKDQPSFKITWFDPHFFPITCQSSPHQRLALFADHCFPDVQGGHSSSVSQYYHQQQNSFSTTDFVSTARTHMCFPISIKLTHPSLRFQLYSKNS